MSYHLTLNTSKNQGLEKYIFSYDTFAKDQFETLVDKEINCLKEINPYTMGGPIAQW